MKCIQVSRNNVYSIPNPFLFHAVFFILIASIILIFPSPSRNLYGEENVSSTVLEIVVDGVIGPPSSYGIERMQHALKAKGFSLSLFS